MFLVAWMVIGLIAGGILTGIVYRGELFHAADMVLGALGGMIGGFVFNMVTREPLQFHAGSLAAAAVGALGMLAGFHRLRRTGRG